MGLLGKFTKKSRLEEELMYRHAFRELNAGIIREGLYAKALVNSPGDEEQIKSLYIEYRVQSIKDELNGMSYSEYMDTLKRNVYKMKKSELIAYAVAKGVQVKDTDTKAKILNKV